MTVHIVLFFLILHFVVIFLTKNIKYFSLSLKIQLYKSHDVSIPTNIFSVIERKCYFFFNSIIDLEFTNYIIYILLFFFKHTY